MTKEESTDEFFTCILNLVNETFIFNKNFIINA